MKKHLFVMLSILLLITGCGKKEDYPLSSATPVVNESDTFRFIHEYNDGNTIKVDVLESDKINYLTTSQALNLIKGGTGIIYFGRPTCPWCRNAINVLLSVARDNDMSINYLNPSDLDSEQIRDYVEIKNILKEKGFILEEDGKVTLYIPDVYFIKDGVIVGHHYNTVDSHLNPAELMNETQKKELYNIYQNYVDEVK